MVGFELQKESNKINQEPEKKTLNKTRVKCITQIKIHRI